MKRKHCLLDVIWSIALVNPLQLWFAMEDVNKIGFIVIQLEQWKNSGPWAIASWLQLGERGVSVFTANWWMAPLDTLIPMPITHCSLFCKPLNNFQRSSWSCIDLQDFLKIILAINYWINKWIGNILPLYIMLFLFVFIFLFCFFDLLVHGLTM